MIFDSTVDNTARPNTYYTDNFYQSDSNDPNTIDRSRHIDGHSKILGMSYDGYPIYGSWGYNASGTVVRETSGYRLKTSLELAGNRPVVTTPSTVTYTVTVSNAAYLFNGASPSFLNLERGKTYVFNLDDSSNDSQQLLIGINQDGWHSQDPVIIGDTTQLFSGPGISYTIDGSSVTYTGY